MNDEALGGTTSIGFRNVTIPSPEQPWGMFNSTLVSYDNTFHHVLPEGGIENLVRLKTQGGKFMPWMYTVEAEECFGI